MLRYVITRILGAVPTMAIVGVITFSLMHITPGDPATFILGADAPPEALEQVRSQLGLEQPFMLQLLSWFGRILTGDFGTSLISGEPVLSMIGSALEPTFMLVLFSMFIAAAIGIPLGIVSAKFRGTAIDYLVMVSSLIGVSIPNFWLGLNFILLFAVYLKLLPVAGYVQVGTDPARTLLYLIMPALTLGLSQAAIIVRITRTSMLDVLGQDYIRTSRAKGLSEFTLIARHALRNALIPIVTIAGTIFAVLLGGAIVVEVVFNLPGLGRLTITAVQTRDYPLIQGIMIVITLSNVLVHVVLDIIYRVIDPRISY